MEDGCEYEDVKKITVKLITLGCKTNLYESEAMSALFLKAGYTIVSGKEAADIYVINTCTVTGTGAQKSRQQIRRARRENPNAIVAVCGCLAQTESETLRRETGADLLVGNRQRSRIVELTARAIRGEKGDYVDDIRKETVYEELGITRSQSRVRANLKIEDGCNNFCAYCIIPYARGPVRSRSLEKIRQEARALGETGYGEVVLTGIQIGAYGRDKKDGAGLIDVIEAVHEADGINRIRLGSLEPVTVTEDFVRRAAKLPKLCPQFHMSLQSGCDETLRRMRRHYNTAEYRRAAERLRDHFADAAITTDLMVGFAGETEEEFQKSYDFCGEMQFAKMHIFPYSIRKGTAAAAFPDQVSEEIKAQRALTMRNLADRMKEAFCRAYLGKTLSVLTEQMQGDACHGTTANYMDVSVQGEERPGQTVLVRAEDYRDGRLIGTVIEEK